MIIADRRRGLIATLPLGARGILFIVFIVFVIAEGGRTELDNSHIRIRD